MSSHIKDPDFYANLGGTIRTLRHLADRTQEEVAAYLEVSFKQVQKYEDGRNRIPIDRLVSLSRFFGVPMERFFSFAPGPTSASPEVSRLLTSLKRPDVRFLTLWAGLRDQRARAAVLTVLQCFTDRPASARTGVVARR